MKDLKKIYRQTNFNTNKLCDTSNFLDGNFNCFARKKLYPFSQNRCNNTTNLVAYQFVVSCS